MKRASTAYMNNSNVVHVGKHTRRRGMTAVILAFVFLLVGGSSMVLLGSPNQASNVALAQAKEGPKKVDHGFMGFACGDMETVGTNMKKGSWRSFIRYYPQPDASGRRWTLQEALGSGARFTGYTGEKGSDNFGVYGVGETRGAKIGDFEGQLTRLTEPRTLGNCVFSPFGVHLGTIMLGAASAITTLSQMAAVTAFDSKLICTTASPESGSKCLNLLKVIGGVNKGDGGGIVGALTGSIYAPMLVFAVLLAGLYIMWVGIIQRQIRSAFFSVGWILLAVIFGYAILLNPQMLSKAPMAVNNAVASCVIGSFNGQDCFNGGGTNNKYDPNANDKSKPQNNSDKICMSEASGISLDDQMSMTVNSLTCSVWRAFILEPWTQGQFGRSFSEMDVSTQPVQTVLGKAKLNANDFCINLGTTGSVNSQNEVLNLTQSNGGQLCNIAAYQLYMGTMASGGSNSVDNPDTKLLDENWYKLAVFAAADDTTWNTWPLSMSSGFNKVAVGGVAILAAIMGGIVIFVISLFALVYYLTSLIMIAFAPLFFLMGVHPGRGRKILFGWVEIVLSNILKYLASAVFLLVTLALYGAILGGMDNLGLTLIILLILTSALLMYRKEIVDLIGRVEMGGEKLSSRFSEAVQARVEKAKEVGVSAVGGALGGVGAAGVSSPMDYMRNAREQMDKDKDLGTNKARRAANLLGSVGKTAAKDIGRGVSGAASGSVSGTKRELRQGNGILAAGMRESARMSEDNKRDAKLISDHNKEESKGHQEKLRHSESEIRSNREQITGVEGDLSAQQPRATAASMFLEESYKVEQKVLMEFKGQPGLVEMQKLATRMESLAAAISAANSKGEYADAQKLQAEYNTVQENYTKRASEIDKNLQSEFQSDFQSAMKEEMRNSGLDYDENTIGDARSSASNTVNDFNKKMDDYDDLLAQDAANVEERNSAKYDLNVTETAGKTYGDKHVDLRPGEGMTLAGMDKLAKKSANEADELNSRPGEMIETHERKFGRMTDNTSMSGVTVGEKRPKPDGDNNGGTNPGGTNPGGGAPGGGAPGGGGLAIPEKSGPIEGIVVDPGGQSNPGRNSGGNSDPSPRRSETISGTVTSRNDQPASDRGNKPLPGAFSGGGSRNSSSSTVVNQGRASSLQGRSVKELNDLKGVLKANLDRDPSDVRSQRALEMLDNELNSRGSSDG